jgi:hypothetical protein
MVKRMENVNAYIYGWVYIHVCILIIWKVYRGIHGYIYTYTYIYIHMDMDI